nr:ribonuclease H-like domain-containing protein [Tanacetum cinerariifolium]
NAESKKMQKSLLKQKFEEFKIYEEEGLDKGNDKMQKILTQMNTLKIKPEPEDVNMKFLRGLPPSWSGNTELRSLENFGMVAGIEITSDADLEGEVVSADNAIPSGVSVSAGDVAAVVVSPQSETEFALMVLSIE